MRAEIKNISCKITCCTMPSDDIIDGSLQTVTCCAFLRKFKKQKNSFNDEKLHTIIPSDTKIDHNYEKKNGHFDDNAKSKR